MKDRFKVVFKQNWFRIKDKEKGRYLKTKGLYKGKMHDWKYPTKQQAESGIRDLLAEGERFMLRYTNMGD